MTDILEDIRKARHALRNIAAATRDVAGLEVKLGHIANNEKLAEPIEERLQALRAEEAALTARLTELRPAVQQLEQRYAAAQSGFAELKQKIAGGVL